MDDDDDGEEINKPRPSNVFLKNEEFEENKENN